MDKRCLIGGEAIYLTFGRKWLKWGSIQFWKLLRQSSDIVWEKSRIACEDRLAKQQTTGYSFPYHWITKPAVVLSLILQNHMTNLHAMVMRGPVFCSCSDKLRDISQRYNSSVSLKTVFREVTTRSRSKKKNCWCMSSGSPKEQFEKW